MPFSLYIHIPYCHSKCPYCDFNSHAASNWPEQAYTEALITEMQARAAEPEWRGHRVKTIFFGGGTPSLFAPRSIGALIEATETAFGVESSAEVTLEANPGTVDDEKLAGFRAAGVNRISFGAQSFNPAILKFLGRLHSAEDTRAAARAARRGGFARLNLDLIFAVPGQTTADVLHDIEEVVALDPDHISAYNLTFEEGTVFFAERKHGLIRELSNDDQAAIFSTVREEIPRRGFPMYEISNYAAPGHEARHNLTYWRAESYLGLGAGAHSFAQDVVEDAAGGRRWWNEKAPSRYIERVLINQIAEVGGETLDWPAAMSEFVFLNLRLREGFATAEFARRFGQPLEDAFGGVSRRLVENGLLIGRGGRIFLSDCGVELGDSVFAEFV